MNKRFQKWMDLKNLNASKLASNIKINRATISHILSGRNKPSIDILSKMIDVYPDLNLNWLISGLGYMSNEDKIITKPKRSLKKITVFYDDASFEELSR
jgi:transcriptional regulator with XRE-family HTH domain|tara:strand:+ start:10770 stop:11066 length:297 start_codon:yes stop_codon:yes gene_type:complete